MTKNNFEIINNTFANNGISYTDFIAWIVLDIAVKSRNGAITHFYQISGLKADGTPLPLIKVAATKFDSGEWLPKEWGTMAMFYPPMTIRQLTHTIKINNRDRIKHVTYYDYVGFIVDSLEPPKYVTPAGCITPNGFDPKIKSFIQADPLDYFSLEKPTIKRDQCFKALDSLLEVCPKNPTVSLLMMAFVARSLLGIFQNMAFSMFIVGHTGTKKTSLALVFQSFLGRGYNSNNSVPVDFHKTTEAGLKSLNTFINHGVILIDEFLTLTDKQSKDDTAKADMILRGISSNSSTIRATPTTELNATNSTNLGIVVTGEHTPIDAKESLHQRIHYLSIKDNDVDIDTLSLIQEYANSGHYEALTYQFIRYLLKNFEELKIQVPNKRISFRTKAREQLGNHLHSRQHENAADLMLGAYFFNRFMKQEMNLSKKEFNSRCNHDWNLIKASTRNQAKIVNLHSLEGEFVTFIKDGIDADKFYLKDFATGKNVSKTRNALFIGYRDQANKIYLLSGKEFLESLYDLVPDKLKKMLPLNSTVFWRKLQNSKVVVRHDISKCTIRKKLPFSGKNVALYHLNLDIG